jgi:hypothetical protein
MTITTLAIVFLLALLLIAVLGQRILSRKTHSMELSSTEQCAICRGSFEKGELIERLIGDYKILYFCRRCIGRLHEDATQNNPMGLSS